MRIADSLVLLYRKGTSNSYNFSDLRSPPVSFTPFSFTSFCFTSFSFPIILSYSSTHLFTSFFILLGVFSLVEFLCESFFRYFFFVRFFFYIYWWYLLQNYAAYCIKLKFFLFIVTSGFQRKFYISKTSLSSGILSLWDFFTYIDDTYSRIMQPVVLS